MTEKEIRPLPRFILSDQKRMILYLTQIIKDLQKGDVSTRCPCVACTKCNRFFTHMKYSTMCPCTALEKGHVTKEELISRLEETIFRLNQGKKE